MNPYMVLCEVQKILNSAGMKAWKSFSEPYYDSIKRQSTSYCVMPGSFSSETPQESSGGMIGVYNFRVRIYSHQKNDIDGDAALRELLDISLKKLLTTLCGHQGVSPNYFQSPVFLTGMGEPGKAFLDKEDFLRFLDCSFQVYLAISW
jgi:hypothetical protein